MSTQGQEPIAAPSGSRRGERETDRQIGAARTITGMLYQSTVVRKELGVKVKLSVYKVDLHSYPHLWL